ncbi:uncharacterized protein LOC119102507 [Pollicipes pollicipes]|uniref:uncharacterized protein LOC119102507 n=1 Tax=Pollicipes pollicipes TaxID=41117 RepID=UPI001884BDA5|nr:uncharacterized protein LOC119102507 [Pollicipes pollicipes]
MSLGKPWLQEDKALVMYKYTPNGRADNMLALNVGEEVLIQSRGSESQGWWKGRIGDRRATSRSRTYRRSTEGSVAALAAAGRPSCRPSAQCVSVPNSDQCMLTRVSIINADSSVLRRKASAENVILPARAACPAA